MAETATPFLSFEGEGCCIASTRCCSARRRARVGSGTVHTVMGHYARFLCYTGKDLICCLVDIVFGSCLVQEALQSAQHMLRTLEQFSWLIPTNCVGVSALGTLVGLATKTYYVPSTAVDSILSGLTALTTGGPSVGVR